MAKKESKGGKFVELEKVAVIPLGKGNEVRFSVVKVGKDTKADIRHFFETEDGLRPSGHGVLIDPEKFEVFKEKVGALAEKLAEY